VNKEMFIGRESVPSDLYTSWVRFGKDWTFKEVKEGDCIFIPNENFTSVNYIIDSKPGDIIVYGLMDVVEGIIKKKKIIYPKSKYWGRRKKTVGR